MKSSYLACNKPIKQTGICKGGLFSRLIYEYVCEDGHKVSSTSKSKTCFAEVKVK